MLGRRNGFSAPLHQPRLDRDQRRAAGVYYTPPEIVRRIVELTLRPLGGLQSDLQRGPLAPRVDKAPQTSETEPVGRPLEILDPACGAGEFLVAAGQLLAKLQGAEPPANLLGIDIDADAVTIARQRLQARETPKIESGFSVGDALSLPALQPGSFDAIVGNPPYVNIRQLAKALPRAAIDALRARYHTARGNFDLYVLFIERALELLRPGGRCGLIIPNKWATLDYARPCRQLLLEQATIEHVIDLSDTRAFATASVYPQIVVFRKQAAAPTHAIRWEDGQPAATTIVQRSLLAASFAFQPSIDAESRVPTAPLGDLAMLTCGTAGYSAQRIAEHLEDVHDMRRPDRRPACDFITSGNIDRYAIRLGNVRYLNHTYRQPRLPLDAPDLTPAKQRLFASPKIVIAGLSRRLEAAWDDCGLALGVQVYAASECHVDPFYLLALLNSKLLSYLFATRFAAKRLAGDYLAINKGQLAQLPIAIPSQSSAGTKPGSGAPPNTVASLANLARRRHRRHSNLLEAQIDRLVYKLYQLTAAEIASVERHIASRQGRAA